MLVIIRIYWLIFIHPWLKSLKYALKLEKNLIKERRFPSCSTLFTRTVKEEGANREKDKKRQGEAVRYQRRRAGVKRDKGGFMEWSHCGHDEVLLFGGRSRCHVVFILFYKPWTDNMSRKADDWFCRSVPVRPRRFDLSRSVSLTSDSGSWRHQLKCAVLIAFVHKKHPFV